MQLSHCIPPSPFNCQSCDNKGDIARLLLGFKLAFRCWCLVLRPQNCNSQLYHDFTFNFTCIYLNHIIKNIICSSQWLNILLIVQNSFVPHDLSTELFLCASSGTTRKIYLAPLGNRTSIFTVGACHHSNYATEHWWVYQTRIEFQLALYKTLLHAISTQSQNQSW